MNPKLEDTVPLDTVIEFIKELMYIAVDIPENMFKDQDNDYQPLKLIGTKTQT